MPKVNEFERRLTAAEGHLLTLTGVCKATGYKSRRAAKSWAERENIRQYVINGRVRYDTHDVAQRIRGSMI